MGEATPRWRRAFDGVERAVGEPLERIVMSRPYVRTVVAGREVGEAVGGVVGRVVGGAARRVLHLAQIPTRSDVQRLDDHIASLATELRQLKGRADEPATPPPGSTAEDD